MKATKTSDMDESNLSIPEAEEIVEEALNELAFSTDPGLARALRFLAPSGYQAIVELCGENGRSKRRNASADTWSESVKVKWLRAQAAGRVRRSSRLSTMRPKTARKQ
jgi:hypothetical protein